ncbi:MULTISPECIES: type IV secretion system protein [Stenotrophomonas]|uniref:Type IV secretion system protein n=2 Tax=Stenotrophomonas lactitubi TaxID=2045214 RepID=A0AAW4GJS1_9GAMM|nr:MULTISPECIES: type IV secretion system protein [Stenotrophomonas]MBM9915356.1 type IV secretion system protein [Stenotrophomonas lactitubi]MBM9923412.1 type IV secretion system protein [Stenotrophomonas lactitubi]MBM9937254.1 type IV secretion system protein [Stenotrophomonas lactitubi]
MMQGMVIGDLLHGTLFASVGDFVFFKLILEYLREEIANFGEGVLGRMMTWVGSIALVLMTLWVLIQGFRIVTGRSRDSMAALATNMARAALIVTVATSMAMFGKDLQSFLTQDVQDEITYVVTGKDDTAEELIDRNLGYMQLALTSVSVLDVAGDVTLDSAKTRAMWFIGLGTGGPAVTAGAMLLLYQVAMAMFIGFGPLFILCLLFEQTKSLFQRWLFYGIGTMFSMAVLAAMTGIAMEMVARVAASFWGASALGALLSTNLTEGMSSMALQQGGMGLILTTLILTAPPMAAMFFQGTLGTFMAYSQIGGSAGSASPGPQGQPPGSHGGGGGGGAYMPPQHSVNRADSATAQVAMPKINDAAPASPGQRGNAVPNGS